MQRFQAEAVYLTLTANLVVAVITEASLRGQIDATEQIIAINEKMLETIRRQFDTGFANRIRFAGSRAGAGKSDLAAAAQGARPSARPDRRVGGDISY